MSSKPLPKLCLVEDDDIMGESLCDRFQLEGFAVDWHKTARQALQAIGRSVYAVVISDIRLPDFSGEELFARLQRDNPGLPPFIFITGFGSIERAVALLKMGAADYVTKPFDLDQLVDKVRALALPRPAPVPGKAAETTLGISPAMQRIEAMLPRLAEHANTVLITGESGVGKERVALLLHRLTPDGGERPFVAVNCGAITESLMEAELFGHEKGAFTGAVRTKKGVFEQAHGGTLFLDEIGDMPAMMQVKLLRAIQERRIVRVGGETPIPVELRLVCATNQDLRHLVEKGSFREDLFYRINVIHLRIPALRERKEDILWFGRMFLAEFAAQHGGGSRVMSAAAEQALLNYPWPGNLRELRHSIERACILSAEPTLGPEALFETLPEGLAAMDRDDAKLEDYIRACERAYILRALEQGQWQIGNTAGYLGISRKNLWERMKRLGIPNPSTEGVP